jgi:hypothetical protein
LVSDINGGTQTAGVGAGPKKDKVTGGWRKLHNEELHNLYSSPNIIRIIKSRRMCRACSTNGAKRNAIGYWWESQKGRDH